MPTPAIPCPGSGDASTFAPAQAVSRTATGKTAQARTTCKVCGRKFLKARVRYYSDGVQLGRGGQVVVPTHKTPA